MFSAYHLWLYHLYKYRRESINTELLVGDEMSKVYNRTLERIFNEEPEGIIRDIMTYQQLNNLFEKSFEQFIIVWENNKALIANESLNQELGKLVLERPATEKNITNLIENLTDEETKYLGGILEQLFNSSKEKLVYLDIWATWCGPCLDEIPDLISLQKQFVQGNITLISLCLSSPKLKWAKHDKVKKTARDSYLSRQNANRSSS